MLLAIRGGLGLDILLSDVYPVAHAALHHPLQEEEFLTCAPRLVEELELEIVKNSVVADRLRVRFLRGVLLAVACLSRGLSRILVLLIIASLQILTNSHARPVALEANDDWLAGAADAVVFFRSDLHTLSNIPIAEAAELRADQVLDRLHLGVEELVRISLRQLENRVVLPEFVGELSVPLDSSRGLALVAVSLR